MIGTVSSTLPRILVIDDNVSIHEDIRNILRVSREDDDLQRMKSELFGVPSSGPEHPEYCIDAACQGQEGLELVKAALATEEPYSMAFVDIRMPPGWDGLETIMHLWEADPNLQVVICTAYSDHSWKEVVRRLGHTDRLLVLKKPFDSLEVRQLALALTTKWRLNRAAQMKVADLERIVHDRTLERVALVEQLHQAQKAEAVGRLVQGIVHDFKNSLAVIAGGIARLRSNPTLDDSSRDAANAIEEAARQAQTVTHSLLAFCRADSAQQSVLDLAAVVTDAERMLRCVLPASVLVEFSAPPQGTVCIRGNPGQLQQVILNLALNARDAMPAGGTLSINVTASGDSATLRVADTGCGMTADVLARAFEPLFTTKPRGQGTGLGLATVRGVVDEHGGRVELQSHPGRGTCVTIVLPTLKPASARLVTTEKNCGTGETVLLVQNRRHLRELIATFLKTAGYKIIAASGAAAAVESLATAAEQPQLLLLDLEGIDEEDRLLERLQAEGLRCPLLLLSDAPGEDPLAWPPGSQVLPKPFGMPALATRVNCMLHENT